MASEIDSILRWFYRESFPQGILEFDELLARAVAKSLRKSQMDVEAYVYANAPRNWSAILQRIDADKLLGRSPMFNVEDIENRKLTWLPSNITSFDSSKKRHLAVKLGSRPYLLRMIDTLTDREYEGLACVISKFAGASYVKLTPRGNEGGIDFFASINCPARCHIFGGAHRPLRIVGQSKKYSDKVQVDEVKEFTTTLEEVRNQNPSIEHLVPTWFRSASGPRVGWLVAHNGVQSGGLTKAGNHGIIVSDSIDLAEIAALSRQISYFTPHSEHVELVRIMVSEIVTTG